LPEARGKQRGTGTADLAGLGRQAVRLPEMPEWARHRLPATKLVANHVLFFPIAKKCGYAILGINLYGDDRCP
jgi:hypothetical protein